MINKNYVNYLFRFLVVQSAGKENSDEEECSQHGSGGREDSFSDSDEEEENKGIITGIDFKGNLHCCNLLSLNY